MKNSINNIKLLIIVASTLILFSSSCSTSKQARKKCRECPEFSFQDTLNHPAVAFNGKI